MRFDKESEIMKWFDHYLENKDIMDLLWEIQNHHGDFRIDPDSILCISEESKKRISMWQQ